MSHCDDGSCHLNNKPADTAGQTPPGDNNAPANNDNKPPKGFLSRMFQKAASWSGPALSAFVAFKGCCIVPKAILVATGVGSTMSAGAGYLALAFSVAAAGGGLYLWKKFRGKVASKVEKGIVIGATVLSLGYSAFQAFNRPAEGCCSGDSCAKPKTEQVVTPGQQQQRAPAHSCH